MTHVLVEPIIRVMEGETPSGIASIQSTLGSSLQDVASNAMNTIGTVLPYALGVVGALIVVKLGIKAFKSITGK